MFVIEVLYFVCTTAHGETLYVFCVYKISNSLDLLYKCDDDDLLSAISRCTLDTFYVCQE
jgi:hypothetical protein